MSEQPIRWSLVPKYVRAEAREIERWVGGLVPVVTQPHGDVWRVTVRSDRVVLVADYSKALGRRPGRWEGIGATTSVDGAEPEPVPGHVELGEIFRDPDARSVLPPADPDVPPLPEETPPGVTVPPQMRALREELTTALGALADEFPDLVTTVRVGPLGPMWMLGADIGTADKPGGIALRLFGMQAKGRWVGPQRDPKKLMLLFVDGENWSDSLEGGLGRLPVVLAAAITRQRPPSDGRSAPPVQGAPAGPATRPTSVQVRNTVVIRN